VTSTLTVAPEAPASGAAPAAELAAPTRLQLDLWRRSPDVELQLLGRAAAPDFDAWLRHVKPAAGCTRPILLAGTIRTLDPDTGRLGPTVFDTADLPDGVIYKRCGNRRHSVCPSCSDRYKRDAFRVIRSGLVGGDGIPFSVATHPTVFATFTAPSFGPVHTRVIRRHSCKDRRRCDCRPEPCHARRAAPRCPHGRLVACFARHEDTDRNLGAPLCLDCHDYPGQVIWNLAAGELWRRTRIAIERRLQRVAEGRSIDPDAIRVSYGKAAEMQRRGIAHFHAIIRLDGVDHERPSGTGPPPAALNVGDLADAVEYAGHTVAFTTEPHRANPQGWRVAWGEQLDVRVVTAGADGEVTDGLVARYLAKYATKDTEVTGHTSYRLTDKTVDRYADADGSHTERLVDACWTLGTPGEWRRLRRWAHKLGFGGHFLTKSRRYGITFGYIRDERLAFVRTITAGPEPDGQAEEQPTTLVVNFLQFVGAGWHTAGDAILANTSAAGAREYNDGAHMDLAALAA
jgi:hypothetical protein